MLSHTAAGLTRLCLHALTAPRLRLCKLSLPSMGTGIVTPTRDISVYQNKNALPDGLRPFTYKNVTRVQQVHNFQFFVICTHRNWCKTVLLFTNPTIHLPPPTTEHSAVQSGNDQFPSLRDMCTTYIPMLTHIPISIRPDVADLFQ